MSPLFQSFQVHLQSIFVDFSVMFEGMVLGLCSAILLFLVQIYQDVNKILHSTTLFSLQTRTSALSLNHNLPNYTNYEI